MKLINLPPIDEIVGLTLYRQYTNDKRCVAFFDAMKKIIYADADYKLNLISQISLEKNDGNSYIQFYYQNLFGLARSLGESRLNKFYDTGEKYDDGVIWDDTNFDGFLDLKSYKTLAKWMLNYSEYTYTPGWLYGFVYEFCEVDSQAVTLTEGYDHIVVNIKRTDLSVLLSRIFLYKDIYLNVPICDVRFNLLDNLNN